MASKKPRTSTKRTAAVKRPTNAKKAPAKKTATKKAVPRRRKVDPSTGEMPKVMDLVMANLVSQYHFGLLQQAFEEGYKKGLEDGLKEGMAAADEQTEVSVHELKTFLRETEDAGIKIRKDDTIGDMTERERDFLEREED